MKSKLSLIIICLFFVIPSHAAWKRIGDTEQVSTYIDPDSAKRDKGIIKIWVLHDFKTPTLDEDTGQKYLSTIKQSFVNCRDESSVTAHISYYSRQQGEGVVITSVSRRPSIDQWTPVIPGSLGEAILRSACAIFR
jgi:hypothetical protein